LRAALATALGVAALVLTGCGAVAHLSDSSGNADRGKTLFASSCGGCHVLADAKTSGVVGPSLDDAFGCDREQEFDVSTIRDTVRGQIAYPETETATGEPGMPANIVRGQDARDVAAYVANVAGVDPAETADDKLACRIAPTG
jgi:mono/diheme cytochrome c family protein